MYYQNEEGIYVYHWKTIYYETYSTRKVAYRYYETIETFFWCNSLQQIKENVGYTVDDKICQAHTEVEYRGRGWRRYIRRRTHCNKVNCTEHPQKGFNAVFNRAWVVADQNGKLFTRDRLVGLYLDWYCANPNPYRSRYSRRNGYKKHAYGGFRSFKTFQERKWANAWDDEEFAPKVRAARNSSNLPNSWDDFYAHSDKCWKTQSKRKHQWKEKNVKL